MSQSSSKQYAVICRGKIKRIVSRHSSGWTLVFFWVVLFCFVLRPLNGACLCADSEGSMPSSQDTVIGSGEKEQERADSPIISLESIQRVVSFSQSFSRPSSQPTATPPGQWPVFFQPCQTLCMHASQHTHVHKPQPCGTSHVATKQCCEYTTAVDIQNTLWKASHLFRITCNKGTVCLLEGE